MEMPPSPTLPVTMVSSAPELESPRLSIRLRTRFFRCLGRIISFLGISFSYFYWIFIGTIFVLSAFYPFTFISSMFPGLSHSPFWVNVIDILVEQTRYWSLTAERSGILMLGSLICVDTVLVWGMVLYYFVKGICRFFCSSDSKSRWSSNAWRFDLMTKEIRSWDWGYDLFIFLLSIAYVFNGARVHKTSTMPMTEQILHEFNLGMKEEATWIWFFFVFSICKFTFSICRLGKENEEKEKPRQEWLWPKQVIGDLEKGLQVNEKC